MNLNPVLIEAIMRVGAMGSTAIHRAERQTMMALCVGKFEARVATAIGDPNPYPLLKEIERELRKGELAEMADAVHHLKKFFFF